MLRLILFFLVSTSAFAATELAKVNGATITLEDFEKKYKESLKYFRFKAPTKANVLDDVIKRELGIQEAKKMNLDKDPEVVERINTVLYHSLLDKKLEQKFDHIQISDDEVASFYKRNPEIRTSHIFVQVRFDATQAQEKAAYNKIKKLEAMLKKELSGGKKTFAEFARQHSEGVAAAAGGDIDYQTKDKLDPTYYNAALKLSMGGVSPIVRSQFGFHIIKLTGKKDFKDVDKGQYKRIIFDEKRAQIFEAYMTELRNKSKVSVNSALLKE
ncbi:MAG: peptidylprolyl isomerase [Bacteriovoracia bacterium]